MTRKEAQYHNHTNSFLNPKTRLDVGSAKAETTNSLNSLFIKIHVNSWATPPLHPHSLLIQKPAVVFIGEARENQRPISFRANSCNSWATPPLHQSIFAMGCPRGTPFLSLTRHRYNFPGIQAVSDVTDNL
ncbi:hypothetical protein [Chlorobium phaeobacteroides]|uniref:hypothetical protein n=1 Tax=Chlorobium phaeobacteroides TaxID=1096 RepID=UPI00059E0B8D|nr:hypothetical protein [Chlorobium phaeobacteroides]